MGLISHLLEEECKHVAEFTKLFVYMYTTKQEKIIPNIYRGNVNITVEPPYSGRLWSMNLWL